MITRHDQSRAAALLWLLEHTDAGQRFMARTELGRRYRAAQAYYGHYDRRTIDWHFATNLDRRSMSMQAVARWWPDAGPAPTGILVLHGRQGCGKTAAAIGLLLRQGGEFVLASDIGEIGLGDAGEEKLDRLRRARLLVLDNLGVESTIGPTLARIRSLIIYRDAQQLPTVITTTLLPFCRDERGNPIPGVKAECTIEGRYDYDVVDRICGDGVWEDVDEGSRRNPRVRPDLRTAQESARLYDLVNEVTKVKRGSGDPRTIEALAAAAKITAEQIRVTAAEAEQGMRQQLANLPDFLRDNPILKRYAEQWGGVAPQET